MYFLSKRDHILFTDGDKTGKDPSSDGGGDDRVGWEMACLNRNHGTIKAPRTVAMNVRERVGRGMSV
jgi:hypothetical protein